MTYEKRECGYVSKPTDPIEGDALDLECSVIVNGIWNTSLVFRNAYDGSEIRGDMTERNGSNIRSMVRIKADTDILAYSCHLEFSSIARQYLESRIFQNSKWTDIFNKEVLCYLPEVYLHAIPSDVAFLCDNMPCGDTASVNDTVTCVAHGYPQPVFDLRIRHLTNKSTDPNSENYDDRFFLDTADGASEVPIKGSENYRISQADVGEIEVTCNVSNSLGWGFNSFKMEISLLRPPDSSRNSSGMVRVDDYSYWLKDHEIMLVNYVAEVGMDVLIASPITPAPLDVRWLSLKTGGELSHHSDEGVSLGTAQYVNKNDTWRLSAFEYDASDGSLKILNVRLDDADVFRVIANENMTGEAIGQTFDVLITLVVFEKHECDITKSPTLEEGDTVILSCSVIVNGMWDVSLIFRNNYDESEIIGETKKCGFQPSVGSMICSSVNVQAKTNILAYVCRLEFFPSKRQDPKNSADRSSKWTTDFTTTADCYVPKAYLNAIPSHVSFLCNNMPCEDTVLVKDTVTCMAHGYPQPVFDLRIRKLSVDTNKTRNGQELDADNDKKDDFFLDTSDESSEEEIKGFKDYLIRQEDVGHVELTCNVSNALGWGYNSLPLEVIGAEDTEVTGGRDSEIFTHKTLTDFTIIISPDSMGAEDTLEPVTEQDASTNSGFNEVSLSHSDLKVLIMCDEIRCGENHTLFVGDQISCIGDGNLTFNRIELTVNRKRTEGDSDGVKYVLQMADIGDITVECIANSSSGSSVVRTVSIIVRQNETGQGMAAGEIDVDEGEQIVVKPTAKPEAAATTASALILYVWYAAQVNSHQCHVKSIIFLLMFNTPRTEAAKGNWLEMRGKVLNYTVIGSESDYEEGSDGSITDAGIWCKPRSQGFAQDDRGRQLYQPVWKDIRLIALLIVILVIFSFVIEHLCLFGGLQVQAYCLITGLHAAVGVISSIYAIVQNILIMPILTPSYMTVHSKFFCLMSLSMSLSRCATLLCSRLVGLITADVFEAVVVEPLATVLLNTAFYINRFPNVLMLHEALGVVFLITVTFLVRLPWSASPSETSVKAVQATCDLAFGLAYYIAGDVGSIDALLVLESVFILRTLVLFYKVFNSVNVAGNPPVRRPTNAIWAGAGLAISTRG